MKFAYPPLQGTANLFRVSEINMPLKSSTIVYTSVRIFKRLQSIEDYTLCCTFLVRNSVARGYLIFFDPSLIYSPAHKKSANCGQKRAGRMLFK